MKWTLGLWVKHPHTYCEMVWSSALMQIRNDLCHFFYHCVTACKSNTTFFDHCLVFIHTGRKSLPQVKEQRTSALSPKLVWEELERKARQVRHRGQLVKKTTKSIHIIILQCCSDQSISVF